jgi:hypothetical protein
VLRLLNVTLDGNAVPIDADGVEVIVVGPSS